MLLKLVTGSFFFLTTLNFFQCFDLIIAKQFGCEKSCIGWTKDSCSTSHLLQVVQKKQTTLFTHCMRLSIVLQLHKDSRQDVTGEAFQN